MRISALVLMVAASFSVTSGHLCAQNFIKDYFKNVPRSYSPDDPFTMGKILRTQVGHGGLYHNCDEEECKRYSPYITWRNQSSECRRPFPITRTIADQAHEIKQRIYWGACKGDLGKTCHCKGCISGGRCVSGLQVFGGHKGRGGHATNCSGAKNCQCNGCLSQTGAVPLQPIDSPKAVASVKQLADNTSEQLDKTRDASRRVIERLTAKSGQTRQSVSASAQKIPTRAASVGATSNNKTTSTNSDREFRMIR